MITDFDKFLSENHVILKAIELRFEVEKRLLTLPSSKLNNDRVLPHNKLKFLERRLDEVEEKLREQGNVIWEAAFDSISNNGICISPEKNWESSFVQNYAIRLAAIDINNLNDCVDTKGTLYVDTVNQLVKTISLIREYYQLFQEKFIEERPSETKIEELEAIIVSQNERIKQFENQILEYLRNQMSVTNQTKPIIEGFACPLHQDIVTEIFYLMINHKPAPQIEAKLKHFKDIFSNEPRQVDEPVKWLISHSKKANNRAFHAFLRIMLDVENDGLTRETLSIANKVFTFNDMPIYPNNEFIYPSKDKTGTDWIKSSRIKHFSSIYELIKKTRP